MATFKSRTKTEEKTSTNFRSRINPKAYSSLVYSNQSAYDVISDYANRINKGEWLSVEDRAAYKSALDSYVSSGNRLRNFAREYGEGYTPDNEKSWQDSILSMTDGYTNINNFYNQFADDREYGVYKTRQDQYAQYNSPLGSERYKANSGYVSGTNNPYYEYINAHGGEAFQGIFQAPGNLLNYVGIGQTTNAYREAGQKGYGEMTEDEIGLYNYYYKTGGKEKAEDYLNFITDDLVRRKAGQEYEEMKGKSDLEKVFYSFVAGMESGAVGIENIGALITGGQSFTPSSSYVSANLRNDFAGSNGQLTAGQVMYDLANTTGNMLPSILVGGMTGGLGGALTMGVSSAGNSYNDLLAQGYTPDQAAAYGVVSGIKEAGMSYLLGGISKLGGKLTNNVISKLTSGVDNAIGRLAIKVGGNMLSEGFEEALQEAIDPVIKMAVTGEDFEGIDIGNVLYSGMLGALSGGMLEGAPNIVGTSINAGLAAAQYGSKPSAVVSTALDINPNSKVAQKASERIAAGKGVSGFSTLSMLENIESGIAKRNNDIAKADTAKIKEAVANRLTELGEKGNISKIADVIAKDVMGESLTEADYQVLNKSSKGYLVVTELNESNVKSGSLASKWAESIGTRRVGDGVYNKRVNTAVKTSDGAQTAIAKVVNAGDGEVTVELADGTQTEAKNIAFNDEKAELVFKTATERVGRVEGWTTETANAMIKAYEVASEMTPESFAKGWIEAYDLGKVKGASSQISVMPYARDLPESVRTRAYNIGSVLTETKTVANTNKGSFTFDSSVTPKKQRNFTKKQKADMKALKIISEALGVNVVVFDSPVNAKNERVGENGKYIPETRTIRIDLHAGNKGEGFVAFTVAHELTHHMRAYAKDSFNTFADAVFKSLGEGKVQERVEARIDSLRKDGRLKSLNESQAYDLAYEEVVADAAERMLADSDALAKLSDELKAKDKTLWQEVKDYISSLVKRIKAIYNTLAPDSVEANLLKETAENYEDILKIWSEGLVKMSQVEDTGVSFAVGETKYSYSSISYSFFGDDNISIKEMESGAYKRAEGYKRYVDQCLNNMRQSIKGFNEKTALAEITKSIDGIVKVAVAMKKAGYDILDTERRRNIRDSKKRLLFSSLEPNSDYFTSSDISTICDKRMNFADIYDEIVRREEAMGVPKNKRFFNNIDNYFVLHKILADKGLTAPCRQCYVESMRKNLDPMANAFIELMQEKNPDNKANKQLYQPSGKNKGELKSSNAELREKLLEVIEREQYDITADDLTIKMLTTADGLAQLKLQAPLIYEAFNSFYGQSKPKMPKAATPFRFGELTALLTDNKGNIKTGLIKKIMATGGFRLQSYSDFQIQNFADVLQVIFEAGTLGLNGHAYTKVPAFLDATKGTNLKRNISIFMYKDGGRWKIDRGDSFPYELEDIYDIVNADESGNTGIIAVVQNEDMAAWIMANDNVGYFIPFHKSGVKMGVVRETIVKEGGREIKGYSDIKDHTRQQTEVWAKTTADHKALTKVKKGINIYDFWDFDNAENLSQKELIEKNVKAYIDACNEAGYLPKFRGYVMDNGKVLNKVLAYAKEFGFVSQNATVDDISFEYSGYRIPYGYYKCLGDFGMFTPNGEASPIERLSLKDYNFNDAVKFFSDAETLRRNEILQQFENGEEREKYRNSDMTTAELQAEVQKRRNQVVDEVVSGEYKTKYKRSDRVTDTDYLDAVNRGDMETAQKMVDEAARAAGYTIKAYHGTNALFNVFESELLGSKNFMASSAYKGFFAAKSRETAENYTGLNNAEVTMAMLNSEAKAKMEQIKAKHHFAEANAEYERAREAFFEEYKNTHGYKEAVTDIVDRFREFYPGVDEKKFKDLARTFEYDWNSADSGNGTNNINQMHSEFKETEASRAFDEINKRIYEEWEQEEIKRRGYVPNIKDLYLKLENPLIHDFKNEGRDVDFTDLIDEAKENKNDGCIFKNVQDGADFDDIYVVFKNTQLKSADPVTYDNKGNVIPLSERFKSENSDIRYSDRNYAPTFYSHMGRVIDDIKLEKMGTSSILNHLKNRGVKDEEIKWSGIEAWLEGKKSVTKAELQEFVAGSQLRIKEQAIGESGKDKKELWDTFRRQMNDVLSWLSPEEIDDMCFDDNGDFSAEKFKEELQKLVDEDEISEMTYEEAVEYAEEMEEGLKAGGTRWGRYKIDGGSNYRELVFKMPNSTYSNNAMRNHWGNDAEGVLAHARIQDFTVDGKKMLFVEEIQSDWHNEGHTEGYGDPKKAEDIRLKALALDKENGIERKSLVEILAKHLEGKVDTPEAAAKSFLDFAYVNDSLYVKYIQKYDIPIDLVVRMNKFRKSRDEAISLHSQSYDLERGIPDAPFRTTYHEYVLKRLLRMAAEEGYDSIGWTTADIQSQRWSDEYAEGYRIEYDQDIPKFLRKYGKKWGASVGKVRLPSLISTEVYYDVNRMEEYETLSEWRDAVANTLKEQGVDLRNVRWDFDSKDYAMAYDGTTGQVYDKAEKRTIGDKVWSMDITDSMKQSVLYEGQVMYQDRESESVSNRSLLANALESATTSQEELDKLREYKKNIEKLNKKTFLLGKMKEDIYELQRSLKIQGKKVSYATFEKQAESKAKSLGFSAKDIKYNKTDNTYSAYVGAREILSADRVKRTVEENTKLAELKEKAAKLERSINYYDRQLVSLESMKPVRDLLQRERAKAYERAAQKGREALHRNVEGRHKTEERHKIQRVIKQLDALLNRGTKDKNVKKGASGLVRAALDLSDMLFATDDELIVNGVGTEYTTAEAAAMDEYVRLYEEYHSYDNSVTEHKERRAFLRSQMTNLKHSFEGVLERERQRINDREAATVYDVLIKEYKKLEKAEEGYLKNAYDKDAAAHIEALKEKLGKTVVGDMTLEQLNDLYKAFKMVKTLVSNSNKLFKAEGNETVEKMGSEALAEIEAKGHKEKFNKVVKKVESFLGWENLKPIYLMERTGSKVLQWLFSKVLGGESVWATDMAEARKYAAEQREAHGYKSWDFEKKVQFTSNTGKTFELNLGQMMTIYAYAKRGEQALEHLRTDGFVYDLTTESKKGMYELNDKTAYKISDEVLLKILGSLSKEQKAYVDAMVKYLSETMGAKGNEVSNVLYGIDLFGEENYFPIRSEGAYLERVREQAKGESKIKNKGYTKPTTPHARNAIVLSDFGKVWSEHVAEMSSYHAFVLPMEDFYRVYNYQTKSDVDADKRGVIPALQNAYSDNATKAIDQLLTDLNGGARGDYREALGKSALSLYKAGKVMASFSVVIQQPSSIVRAGALIDPKFFVGKKIDKKKHKALWEEVKKYAPVAIIKEMGHFDVGMGRASAEWLMAEEYEGIKEKAKALVLDSDYRNDVLSKPASYADEVTWVAIWNAVKRETASKNPKMSTSSEEFLKKAGERFEDIIRRTQVYDSTLSRSGNMRVKSPYTQMLTAFMAEPTTSINMREMALRSGDAKKILRTTAAVYGAALLNSVLVALPYAMRDDDEDETFAEKYITALSSSFLDNVNPLNSLPFVKDVWSIAQGYSIDRMDASMADDLINSLKKIVMVASDEDREDGAIWGAVGDVVLNLSAFTGVPLRNIWRDIKSIINFGKTISRDIEGMETTWMSIGDAMEEMIRNETPILGWLPGESKGDKLYDALVAGDTKYVARFKATYKDESSYLSAVRKALRENDPRMREAAEAYINKDYALYNALRDEIVKEGVFDRKLVTDALKAEINYLKNKEK